MSELSLLAGTSKTYNTGKYLIFRKYLTEWNLEAYHQIVIFNKDTEQLIGAFPIYLKDIINKKYSEIEKLVKGKYMAIIEKDKNDR